MTTNGGTTSLPEPAGVLHAAGAQRSGIENIFMGPHGMRAGWRLLIFIFLMFACLQTEGFTLKHIPAVATWFKTQDPQVITAPVALFSESILLLALMISTAVMAADRETKLRGLLFAAKAVFGEAILAGRAVRVRHALVAAGTDRGVSWIFVRRHGAFWRGRAEIWSTVRDFIPDGRDLRGILFSRIYAGDSGAVNRVLARGDYAFDLVWRDSFEQSG